MFVPIFSSFVAIFDLDLDHNSIAEYVLNLPRVDRKTQLDVNDKFLQEYYVEVHHKLNMIHHQIGLSKKYEQALADSWANIEEQDRTSRSHCHINQTLISVYYPRVDEGGGSIDLVNPAPAVEWCYPTTPEENVIDEYTTFSSITHRIVPKTGQVLIFPAYIYHHVNENRFNSTSGYRISIATNSKLQKITT